MLLQDNTEDALAKTREIRDFGMAEKSSASYGICRTLKKWPKGKSYILTTMLQVLMWDTINSVVDGSVLKQVASGTYLIFALRLAKY